MIVHHYSPRKIKEIADVNCNHLESSPYVRPLYKNRKHISWDDEYSTPHVFWVSVPGRSSWIRCRGSNAGDYNYKYTIKLKASKRSFIMNNMEDVYRFTDEFSIETSNRGIKWRKVCRRYDFIYLSFWTIEMANHGYWYSQWDCASGVIFKTRIIKSAREERL